MTKLRVSDIKALFTAVTRSDDPLFAQFRTDPRKGVQRIIQSTTHRLKKEKLAMMAFGHRFKYEHQFWAAGKQFIAGVDEVGRGPLAGPVVSCAVILPHDFDLVTVNDSKQLSRQVREELAPKIRAKAVGIGFGIVDNHQIDRLNIYQATRVAMREAVLGLSPQPEEIIVDAMQIDVPIHQTRLIRGDTKSVSVAAASILAKVYRDHLMAELAKRYPEYGFERNAGYGTAEHLAALEKFGATPIHRKTFKPVDQFLK